MSTHVPGFQSFLHHFVLAKLASSRPKDYHTTVVTSRFITYKQNIIPTIGLVRGTYKSMIGALSTKYNFYRDEYKLIGPY